MLGLGGLGSWGRNQGCHAGVLVTLVTTFTVTRGGGVEKVALPFTTRVALRRFQGLGGLGWDFGG
jgi:hypothetical protein